MINRIIAEIRELMKKGYVPINLQNEIMAALHSRNPRKLDFIVEKLGIERKNFENTPKSPIKVDNTLYIDADTLEEI